MRVAILNKSGEQSGGAGRMAGNLHTWLVADGIDARLLTAHDVGLELAYPKWVHTLKALEVRTLMNEALPIEFLPVLNTLRHLRPDVVHFHDISRAFSIDTVRMIAERFPTIWTLHDQSPVTGGCISPHPCQRDAVGCGHCPKFGSWSIQGRVDLTARAVDHKRQLMERRTVTLAAPSAWAARRFESSPIVPDDVRVNVVHNAINSADYRPIPRADARRWLDLPEDRFIITIISHDLSDVTKNPESQRAALRAVAHLRPLLLLVGNIFGNPAVVYDPLDLRVMGFVKEEALKNAIFASSDIFLNTSLSDTFSLTTLEALASGTPVVAYASGGIPEVIVDGECGELVPPDDAEALSASLARLITEGVPDSWRSKAHKRAAVFSPSAHVKGYRALYDQTMAAAR